LKVVFSLIYYNPSIISRLTNSDVWFLTLCGIIYHGKWNVTKKKRLII